MVARGDLGAQIPLEKVPSVQKRIVELGRKFNKLVIVASQLLESMIEYPIPTTMGRYYEKALAVLRSVSLRIERWWREEKHHAALEPLIIQSSVCGGVPEEMCNAAIKMERRSACLENLINREIDGLKSLMAECPEDKDLVDMSIEELNQAVEEEKKLQSLLLNSLLPKDDAATQFFTSLKA
ncbi:hypothetical protein Pint_16729 [Pistacia integerrima]|uniref:Uncharacterized protein n=1 Tax=Pistacia integerrima TaxID=434235 RepID=A0ACC0Z8X3_9ROSI|nr:hypothetical protein Pint_16729 [Pistacia integerrima]